MSVFKDILKLAEKLPEGVKHARDEAIGILNPNRRHDEQHEIAADEVRTAINESHRFESFATERDDNFVKWHIDGHDYMWAVSEMLENAKECIFILDWWLTPQLYLRRPPAKHPEWRLDKILKRKVDQGVKVHVIVYKEVTQTMTMSSKLTKMALESIGVQIMRHPDHIGSKDSVQFWSHHEKVVVVDNHFAAIGGLDLCFGRWDTHTHPLADVHPTHWNETLFPGQDYNNARIMDFQNVGNYASNALSLQDNARMPWHDVHMTFTGPAVLDVCQHFVERWNEIKKRKYRDRENVDWLALPHEVEHAPEEAVARHPHREAWLERGRRYRQRFHWNTDEPSRRDEEGYGRPDPSTCKVQVVRSVSDWSHGVLTEHSIQNAYIQLIREANHFIYIENQFFISATKDGEQIKNRIAGALVERIVRAAQEGRKFFVYVVIPEVPGFAGNIKDEASVKIIMAGQYRTMNRGGSSIYEEVRKAGYEPMDYIRFYHLRAYDRINAPKSYIQKLEEVSGVSFHTVQVALARIWVNDPNGNESSQQKVAIKQPEPTTEGMLVGNKTDAKIEEVAIPQSEEEARDIIRRFEEAAEQVRQDEDVADNVVQHMLLDRTGLQDEKWLGTEEEERDAYVSELLYIHSKLMIVDDTRVIMGSANINDRSQKGDGDSEIALVVEDTDLIESSMNGQPHMAGRFATTLRRKLFREHLGLIPPQIPDEEDDHPSSFMRPAPHANEDETQLREDEMVADPLSEETMRLWNDTAKKNREVFTEVFRPVPTNLVRSWSAYDGYVPKVKTGHVVPDIPLDRIKQKLSEVRGSLVECPIDFLIDEKEFVSGPDWAGLNPTLPIYI
ncbi:phospholipase D/nuclease [Marasmius fiardii PR-910]|nr:phospholipase D/nuclease [Marasmius fiardii PR-910]